MSFFYRYGGGDSLQPSSMCGRNVPGQERYSTEEIAPTSFLLISVTTE